jgi:hypothetical protein
MISRISNRVSVFMCLIGILYTSPIWAQGQIATVTSSAPFTLRGATVTPGQGVPSWPIMAGDVITGGSAPTVVTFPDGSVVSMAPASQARIGFEGGKPVFHLLCGSSDYSLRSLTSVGLSGSSGAVTPGSAGGALNRAACTGGSAAHTATSGSWSSTHITLVAVAGAAVAAGLGLGISSAVNGGTPVSPSQ